MVITGVGVISPVGKSQQEAWENLVGGVSGIEALVLDDDKVKLDVRNIARVKDFDLEDYYPDKATSMKKDMDRVCQLAMAAAKEAIDQSQIIGALESEKLKYSDVAVFVGTGIGGMSTIYDDMWTMIDKGPRRVGVRTIFRLMPNAAAGQIAIEYGFQGQAKSESTACASGLDAMLSAYNNIKSGASKAVVTGGTEACISSLALASFNNMKALSRRGCDAKEASCPFSAERDGFVMGEGAVLFVLEDRDFAISRGANIIAEIVGGAGICDAYHITAPAPEGKGAAQAITEAIRVSGIQPEDIGYVHAHGTSTPLNDARETAAIKTAFGEHAKKLKVSSTKSMTGHMIGGAGPMGVFASIQALSEQVVPPTINYRVPDPECDLDYVPNESQKVSGLQYAMVNALGFGGHNTCLVIKGAKD